MCLKVELESFAGLHTLSGWDDVIKIPTDVSNGWGNNSFDYENGAAFILDGVTYCAIEDPGDGYRSYLEGIYVSSDYQVLNKFEPQPVIVEALDDASAVFRGLVASDPTTNKEVFVVGEDNLDDYYPYFTAHFSPEAMACNQQGKVVG